MGYNNCMLIKINILTKEFDFQIAEIEIILQMHSQ